MLVCVRGATSNIDALCDCAILHTDSTVCIGLNYRIRTFSGTVQFSVNVIVGNEYFITNLIVMVDSKTIFLHSVSAGVSSPSLNFSR